MEKSYPGKGRAGGHGKDSAENLLTEEQKIQDTEPALGKISNDQTPGQPAKVKTVEILFLGDFGVGKTSIIRRYVEGQFDSFSPATIGFDYCTKKVDQNIKLKIWDSAGLEKHTSMINSQIKSSNLVVLCYAMH